MKMREIINLVEGDVCPNILYHATFRGNLPSISKRGLTCRPERRNYDISRPGVVYLTDDPDSAEEYARSSERASGDDIVLLEIDVAQLNPRFLFTDENNDGWLGDTSYQYTSDIPPTAIRII